MREGDNTERRDEASDGAEDTLLDCLEPPDTAGGQGHACAEAGGLWPPPSAPGGLLCQRHGRPGGAELGSQIYL